MPLVQPQVVPVFATATEGGLFKRYVDTDALPKKARLRPIRVTSEPTPRSVEQGDWHGSIPETPIAFTVPARPFEEEKTPEVVGAGARPLGLLSRYAMEKHASSE